MSIFMIERNFAEQLEITPEAATEIAADQKKTYCLYEASNAEAVREAARRLNVPADVIIELSGALTTAGDLRSIDTDTRLNI
jgi:hypothetical protein